MRRALYHFGQHCTLSILKNIVVVNILISKIQIKVAETTVRRYTAYVFF